MNHSAAQVIYIIGGRGGTGRFSPSTADMEQHFLYSIIDIM